MNQNNYPQIGFSKKAIYWYKPEWLLIKAILNKHGINYSLLTATKDIWCRDYMPVVNAKDELVQFRYQPSYLKGKENDKYRSLPKEVHAANNIKVDLWSDLNLDGGNILRFENMFIISDRVFEENRELYRPEVLTELESTLKGEIIIIPALTKEHDMTGHADGHVRWANKDTLLVNALEDEHPYWVKGFRKIIKDYNFNIVEMPWFIDETTKHSAVGCYVNYLELGSVIIAPIFNHELDHKALSVLQEYFPDKTIEPVRIDRIGHAGGLMNCCSWDC